jgi:YVTN family beta-propeller protein
MCGMGFIFIIFLETPNMKIKLLVASLFLSATLLGQTAMELYNRKVLLPNGWSLTPAGYNIPVGDLPLNIAVSHNKKFAVVTNNGLSTQTIDLIDLRSKKRIDTIIINKSWYGLAFSSDDNLIYASGGHDNEINVYSINKNKLSLVDSIVLGNPWPKHIGIAGFEVDDTKNKKLFIVTTEDSSLYVVDLFTKKTIQKLQLNCENYSCKLSSDKKKLYISSWGGRKILVYDVQQQKIVNEISVGSHPNELCLSRNGNYLYVANADDNSVSVISTKTNQVIETLNAALYPNALSGSTTNGIALSQDQKTLYIANADNNCLAVFDVSEPGKSFSKGFIPVGWYPTNVQVAGKQILVTNGKGLSSLANPHGPNPVMDGVLSHASDTTKKVEVQYIGGLFKGALSFIPEPRPVQLGIYSQAVYSNTPYTKCKESVVQGEQGNPIPMKTGNKSPVIKYVFYIIKENRTYDQVLGDVKNGNGDTSLCLFGERITPNQHKLVNDFVLLDNFFVNAEVSADGHNWSMGAYANDYLEKTWPTNYSGRGGTYSAEGDRTIANNRDGFIWNNAQRSNVTFRTYGEFVFKGKATLDVLKNHFAPYTGFDMKVADTTRFAQWKKDFDSLLNINAVPQISTIRFSNDHTEGMRGGSHTPFAFAADNDLAVGMFVDYVSKSRIWKNCAIFILEDDAQNGPDHVDAHRSAAYLISPYVKRNFVDHTMYSTTGIIRTMELILGMPSMTQYDAAATPLWRCFTTNPNFTPYNYLPANINLNDRNPKKGKLAMLSEKFNWSKEDAVPDLSFNELLWQGLKGTPAPAPVRSAFLKAKHQKDDDD